MTELFMHINNDPNLSLWYTALPYLFESLPIVKYYPNFYLDRSQIRRDHRNPSLSAIYMFVNIENPSKIYIGQSKNVENRVNSYLNTSHLKSKNNKNSPFIKALLKYGQSGFSFIILEYVPIDQLNDREIFWIALLRPYYNVLPGGKGSLGFKHTEETIKKLRKLHQGSTLPLEVKRRISDALKGNNNPFWGKTHSENSKTAISKAKSNGCVFIYNSSMELLLIVSSVRTLSKNIHSNSSTIVSHITSGSLFRGEWYLSYTSKGDNVIPKIEDQNANEAKVIYNNISNAKNIIKPVFFRGKTQTLICRYEGVLACAKDLKISHNKITKLARVNGKVGHYIVSNSPSLDD